MNVCPGCGRLDDAPLCFDCLRTLRRKLLLAVWLAQQLETTITRQARTADPYRPPSPDAETPLAFDETASETAWILRQTLEAWADEIGMPDEIRFHAAVIARWMCEHVMRLVHIRDIAQAIDEIGDAVSLALRTVDQPTTRQYCGNCCDTPLYADSEAIFVECRVCRREHLIDELREDNRLFGRETMITAREAEKYIGEINGKRVRANTVTKWGTRGKITRYDGYYRLGDILDQFA